MYKFKTKPYDHQLKVFNQSKDSENFALFMEMGTGKTKVAIDTIGYLYQTKKIDAAFIIAPKGVYDNWVQKEIPQHLPNEIPSIVLRWQPNITQAYKKEFMDFVEATGHLKLFVMNIEALSTEKGSETAKWLFRKYPSSMMVVDESTTIKNRKAMRTRNVSSLGQLCRYKRILTGSPVTKSPMDLYSQIGFLSDKLLGFTSYYAFQGRYAVVKRRTMGHRSFQEIAGYQRLDELNEKIEEFSSRVLKKDCLDLPDKIFVRRNVALTDEQKKHYCEMKKLALTLFQDGMLSTTSSVLTQIMRLQQICCGFIKDDDETIRSINSNRITELIDILDETSGKVIIWASFVHDITAIRDALAKEYGEEAVVTYYGETPQEERQQIVKNFQEDETTRFFIGQPRTGGFGLTLHAASTVIYYSNSYDLEIRLQSEDRAHRIGQKNNVTYIDLVSPGTIDEKIINALRDKINIAGQVLNETIESWIV